MHGSRRATGIEKRSSRRFVSILALAASLAGCSGTSGDDAAPPKTQPSPLEKVTVATYPAWTPLAPAGSECPGGNYPLTQTVDASSYELSWEECKLNGNTTPATLEHGSRTLTDTEFRSVTSALAKVQVTHDQNCGADANVVTLDVQNESGTDRYANDFYSGCPWDLQDGRTFASGLEELASTTQELVLNAPVR